MNEYLLYCIFDRAVANALTTHPGIDGQPVIQIEENGLCAAVSKTVHFDAVPSIARVLTYKRVIESFHRHHTVIPVRYGCLVKGKQQGRQLLENRSCEYKKLLEQLEGCEEMGIRALIDDDGSGVSDVMDKQQRSSLPNRPLKAAGPETEGMGQDYLLYRKTCYEKEDQFIHAVRELSDRYRDAFSGLYVKFGSENHKTRVMNGNKRHHLLSFYFLVPRSCVASFRKVFKDMSRTESTKLLLSGPWPPYNFVVPDLF